MSYQLLFVNVCARENSRTLTLCKHFLDEFSKQVPCEIKEVNLFAEDIAPLVTHTLAKRDELAAQGRFDDPMFRFAKDFAAADLIVIGAPYWDLSFPAMLKVYVERVCVVRLTFRYTVENRPASMCRAKGLVYLCTAGGPIGKHTSGEAYMRDLCDLFAIGERRFVYAENLDVVGQDVPALLAAARQNTSAACAAVVPLFR